MDSDLILSPISVLESQDSHIFAQTVASETETGDGSDTSTMEFEARSARDGAWYDVAEFISYRQVESADPEVLVRFAGFGSEEDEWINVPKHVRQKSLPCESNDCMIICPGDLILCFQDGKDQALYYDAHILDSQRRRHDVRGCRCRFLVRYDHDQSQEIVPLWKICRRPETDARLQQIVADAAAAAATGGAQQGINPNPSAGEGQQGSTTPPADGTQQ